MNLQTMRNRVYIHTRDFKRERFDPLLIDRLLSEAQEEFNAQTKIYRTSADLTTTSGVADLVTGTVSGQLTKIEITNGGSGYTSAPSVTFTGGGGSGATATAVIQNGRVVQIVITDPGKAYTSAPTVGFTPAPTGGTPATAVATVATQDIPAIQGEILRVEDRSISPYTALVRTSEEALDVLVGPAWRGNSVGLPQFYIRGKGGIQYAGTSDGTTNYSGYEALTIYPLVNGRLIRVWYIKRPDDLVGDFDVPAIPEHYHMALVWHATSTLLAESMAEGDNAKAAQAQARYQEFVRRGIEEADQSLRWR